MKKLFAKMDKAVLYLLGTDDYKTGVRRMLYIIIVVAVIASIVK